MKIAQRTTIDGVPITGGNSYDLIDNAFNGWLDGIVETGKRGSLTREEFKATMLNAGAKGDAVRQLAARVTAPVFFVDDIPTHHTSVAERANHVHRIHYVADPRLSLLLGPAEHSHLRATDWNNIHQYVIEVLDREGY